MIPQVNSLISQAIQNFQSGNFEQAKKILTYVVLVEPNNVGVLELLGAIFVQQGDSQEALNHFEKITKIQPDSAIAWSNRGISLLGLKQYEQAVFSYDKAISIKADYALAWYNRGNALSELKQYDKAVASYDQTISIQSDFSEAWYNRGNALTALKQYDQAIASYDQAVSIKPDHFLAWYNRGNALSELQLYEQAITSYDKAISIRPGTAEAWSNRGNALSELKRYGQAIDSYDKAVSIQTDYASAYWNKSLIQLLMADFKSGWSNFEYRWLRDGAEKKCYQQIRSLLSLGDIKSKTVLIWREQGYGDTIQFSRYVDLLTQLGANVVFDVQPPLKSLLAHSFPKMKIITRGESVNGIDFQIPLLSLPGLFATDLTNIPASNRYLQPTPSTSSEWRKRLNLNRSKPNIGIACSGSEAHKNDKNRSMALKLFEPLSRITNLFLLQKDIRETDREFLNNHSEINFLGDQISSFDESASMVDEMDLVITVDTSLAHLAGALGKPTILLLPWAPEWRWLLDCHDSPWYPSVKIFRQPKAGDWESVIQDVLVDLKLNESRSK